jgi:acetyltransferase-like isoleucine patch superfamily enzyme
LDHERGRLTAIIRGTMHYFLVVSYEFFLRLVFGLPRYRLANALKAALLKMNGAKVGKRCVFYPGVWIMTGKNLEVGEEVDFALDVLVTTGGGVRIGDRTLIGYRTQILSSNHRVPPLPARIFDAGHEGKPVTIGNDVWIGANCLILPGVAIGDGCVIGAGSVVTKSIEANSIAVGNPARVIRNRD